MASRMNEHFNKSGDYVENLYGQTSDKIDEVPLDLSMEKPGAYFLKIKAEEGTYLKRLFVS